MGKNNKILAVIPARGGSKRIPGKNIRNLMGKPLIAYSIQAAAKSKYVDRVVVSTDDKEIAGVSKNWGAQVIDRPSQLATDASKTIDAILHALSTLKKENYVPQIVILLQPTSPLRTNFDIDNAIEIFQKNKCDSVISVLGAERSLNWLMRRKSPYLVPASTKTNFEKESQNLPELYLPNGAIYVLSASKIIKEKKIYLSKILPYIMPKEKSIDIDEEPDFKLIEDILRNEK